MVKPFQYSNSIVLSTIHSFIQNPQEGEAMQPQHTTSMDDLVPSKTIPIKFPELYSQKQWAWAVKQRHKNGLARAFRKVGKNLIVNIPILAECIEEQSEK